MSGCCIAPDGSPLVAVLAAGQASRFGGGKLDVMLCGKRVGQWGLDAVHAAGFAPGIIVVPDETPQFAQESGWSLQVNPNARQGLGTSLALAANRAMAQGRPLLVLLADMPLVSGKHLQRLGNGEGSAATVWPKGKAGVPAWIAPPLLPRLSALKSDAGAGALLSSQADIAYVEADAAMLLDVDEPEDLDRAEALLSQRG